MCQPDSKPFQKSNTNPKFHPRLSFEKDVATGTTWFIIPQPNSHALKQPRKIYWFHLICDGQFLNLIGLSFFDMFSLGGGGCRPPPLLSSLLEDLSQRNFVQGLTIKALAQILKKFT